MRAPIDSLGTSRGRYVPQEHIGHLKRIYSASLAPVMDNFTEKIDSQEVSFEAHLSLCDTNHKKKGYELEIIVSTNNDDDLIQILLSQFVDANIVFRMLN